MEIIFYLKISFQIKSLLESFGIVSLTLKSMWIDQYGGRLTASLLPSRRPRLGHQALTSKLLAVKEKSWVLSNQNTYMYNRIPSYIISESKSKVSIDKSDLNNHSNKH